MNTTLREIIHSDSFFMRIIIFSSMYLGCIMSRLFSVLEGLYSWKEFLIMSGGLLLIYIFYIVVRIFVEYFVAKIIYWRKNRIEM